MLTIENLDAGYRRVRVLYDVTLSIGAGETVGVLGPNGAGKTTLLRAIAGNCTVYAGRLEFGGVPLTDKPDHVRASLGIAHVAGRPSNLALVERRRKSDDGRLAPPACRAAPGSPSNAGVCPRSVSAAARTHEPARRRPQRRRAANAGNRSRADVKAELLLVDEPSIGLAPIMMEAVMEALRRLRQDQNLSIMLVEQRIQDVLDFCDRDLHSQSRPNGGERLHA